MVRHRIRVRLAMALAVGCLIGLASAVHAQAAGGRNGQHGIDLKLVAGYSGFIDEEMIDHGVVGGALRVALTPRVAVEGDVLYMRGPGSDRDWLFMPSVTVDLRTGGMVVPYLVAGAGWLRNTNSVGTGLYTSTSWTASGGGGVRVDVAPGLYVACEVRLGSEPLTQATVALGWRLRSPNP